MNDKFSVARFVLELLSIIGWVTVIAALATAVVMATDHAPIETFLVPVGIAVSGLLLVAIAQIAKAQIVTAENSGEIVSLLQASISSGGPSRELRPAPAHTPEKAPLRAPSGDVVVHERNQVGTPVKRHNGKVIVREPQGFSIDGEGAYPTVTAAEQAIDKMN